MNWLMVKKDLVRNKAIHLALLLFIVFSAMLAVVSATMAVQTFTSISQLYKTAQPPHFLQMHKGEIDEDQLKEFMSGYDGVTYWQADAMLDIYGDDLTVKRDKNTYKLSDCRLDIGLVKQNEVRDLLLNSRHQKISLKVGEIGMPVLLKEMYGMGIGDRVILSADGVTKEFVIKEFVLDSMMNSTMCSSTRILLSDEDYSSLSGRVGEKEYLIEAYFTDSKEAAAFQTAYENAGLPQNGQPITYTMIFLLSAFTDITTVFVLLLASILLILVSFICVRFTIMAALEEDLGEIGTLKAVGLSFKDIRSLYLMKYKALAAAGTVAGYILAMLAGRMFTKHISTTFGYIGISALTVLLSFAAAGLVFLLILYYCRRVLKKIKKLTVVDALVSGRGFNKKMGRVKDGLYKSRLLPVNWLMGLREAFYQFRSWVIVFAVVIIAVLMILIPSNLINTFQAPEFITYMGSQTDDILIEIDNGDRLEESYANVKQVLSSDADISNYHEYRSVRLQTYDAESMLTNLNIDCADNAGNELKYLSGKAPEGENEIALSYLNASELGKKAGDPVRLLYQNTEKEFKISGIYQDVTSGGYTAKSKYSFSQVPADKYSFTINIKDNTEAINKAEEWSKTLGPGVDVEPMKEFLDQTLGGIVRQLKTIVNLIIVISACLVMLICVLFLKLRLAKDQPEIAALKAIGFSVRDIQRQYLIKTGCISIAGLVLGIIGTNVFGEKLVNAALGMSGLGITSVRLIPDPVTVYILCPLLLLLIILLVTRGVLKAVAKYNIITMVKE